MPKVAGLQTDSEMAKIADYALAAGWRVEATGKNQLKYLGPNGEGPVYTSVRSAGSRPFENALAELVRAGLPKPASGHSKKVEDAPVGAVLTVVQDVAEEPDDLDTIIGEYVSTTSKAVEKLQSALENRLSAIRKLRIEAEEWQELATQQADAVEAAQAEAREAVLAVEAERDAALERAEKAEAKLDAILAPMRAALRDN